MNSNYPLKITIHLKLNSNYPLKEFLLVNPPAEGEAHQDCKHLISNRHLFKDKFLIFSNVLFTNRRLFMNNPFEKISISFFKYKKTANVQKMQMIPLLKKKQKSKKKKLLACRNTVMRKPVSTLREITCTELIILGRHPLILLLN